MAKSKLDSVQEKLKSIQAKYGDKIHKGSELIQFSPDRCYSSGNAAVDWALGGFGVPMGRVVEFYGPESGGKTSLCLNIIAQAQAKGVNCAFVDAEHSLDPSYLKNNNVNAEELLIIDPNYGEEGFQFIEDIIDVYKLIVVDSVTAMLPKVEDESDYDKADMALQARMMSKGLRKLIGKLHDADATVIFINQEREKVGVVYGSPTVTTGGNSLKFYAAVRARITKKEYLLPPGVKGDQKTSKDDATDKWGQLCSIRNYKNKCGPPHREAPFEIYFGKHGRRGIIAEPGLRDRGVALGVIEQSGAWYSYGGEKIGQGKEGVVNSMCDDPKLAKAIAQDIVKAQQALDVQDGIKVVKDTKVDVTDGEDSTES